MTAEELIKSLRICSAHDISCTDCFYFDGDSSCLTRLLSSAADRLQALSVALEMAREENAALVAEKGVLPYGD